MKTLLIITLIALLFILSAITIPMITTRDELRMDIGELEEKLADVMGNCVLLLDNKGTIIHLPKGCTHD